MTELITTLNAQDGKPIFRLQNAVIKYIEDEKSGISNRTGNPWRMRNVNVQVDRGSGNPCDYLRLKFNGPMCEQFNNQGLKSGDLIDVNIQFTLSRGNFQYTEVLAISF